MSTPDWRKAEAYESLPLDLAEFYDGDEHIHVADEDDFEWPDFVEAPPQRIYIPQIVLVDPNELKRHENRDFWLTVNVLLIFFIVIGLMA
jgi:hypothetical protein